MTDIINRLEQMGYTIIETDNIVLKFICEKVENHIKNFCNINEIPDGLKQAYVDMVCGEFLHEKFSLNQLGDFNVDDAIASVTMGDVSVSYDKNSSNSSKIQALIDGLKNQEVGDMVCYRKLKW